MVWWTLQTFIIAGVLAGVVQVVCRLGRFGPVGRHALWLIVLVKLVTPPLILLHWPWNLPAPLQLTNRLLEATSKRAEAGSLTVARVTIGPDVGATPEPSEPPSSTAKVRDVAAPTLPVSPGLEMGDPQTWRRDDVPLAALRDAISGLTVIWLIGGIAFALIQCVRIGRVSRSVGTAGPAGPWLSDQVDALARSLRVRAVRTHVIAGSSSPLIWCVNPLRPQLLWPAALPPDVSEDCRRALIIHELAHVKRGDHWIGWLELIAGCAWWWNPLFWYVRSQLRENAELACDGWVISELPGSRRAYAEALLAVCAGTVAPSAPIPAVGISTGGRRFLERRLAMIMQERVPLRLSRVGLLSLIVLTFATLPAWAQRSLGSSFSSADLRIQGAPLQDRASVDETVRGGVISRAVRANPSFERGSTVAPRDVAPVETVAQSVAPRVPTHIEELTHQAAQNQPRQPIIIPPAATADAERSVPLTLDDAVRAYVTRNLSLSAVRNAYWEFVYATEAVALARQSLALSTKLVEDNTVKLEARSVAPIDVTSAKAAEATRRVALAQAELNRQSAEIGLKSLIAGGYDPNWRATLDPIDRPEFSLEPVDVQTAIARALARELRPEPVDATTAAAARALELRVANAVTQAAVALRNTAESVQAAQNARALKQQQLEAEQSKFEVGMSTNYQVVQYQRDLNEARVSELRAVLNYRKARDEWDRLQETGLPKRNDAAR